MTGVYNWFAEELHASSGVGLARGRAGRAAVLFAGALLALGVGGCASEMVDPDAAYDDDVDLLEEDPDLIHKAHLMVGVVPTANTNCPNGSVPAEYYFDDEDSANNNSRSGWIGANTSTNNTTMRFCAVDGSRFRQVRSSNTAHNYAVLKLGASCPAGSVPFTRYFDNEDYDCNNTSTTDSGGNFMYCDNWTMNFCMFRANPSASSFSFPSIGISYGVLGGAGLLGTIESGNMYLDNEDDRNNNGLTGDFTGVGTFMDTGSNTRIRYSRVR